MTEAASTYRALRERILRADYRPGAVLVEDELTSSLGVGRTPLRDALQRLALFANSRLADPTGLSGVEPASELLGCNIDVAQNRTDEPTAQIFATVVGEGGGPSVRVSEEAMASAPANL